MISLAKLQQGISSIIVEFHNIMTHHSIQLQNKEDFTLADLSDTCLILASTGKDREEGEAERSTIKCLNYKTWWDKNKVSHVIANRHSDWSILGMEY